MPTEKYKPEAYFVIRERNNHGNFPALLLANVLLEARTAKRYGHCASMAGHIDYKRRLRAFWVTKGDIFKISRFILKKILQDPLFITTTKAESDKLSRVLLGFIKQHQGPQALRRMTNKQLADVYLKYCKLYTDYHFINSVPWVVASDSLADYLKEYLSRAVSKKEALRSFTVLATPAVASYTFNQELGFLKIVSAVQANKALAFVFKKEKLSAVGRALKEQKIILSLLKKHSEKFGWIPFDYIGPSTWDENYFIEEIKKFISEGKSASKELAKRGAYHRNLKAEQKAIQKKLKISKDDFRVFQDLQTLTVLQDNRKETAVQTHVWLERVMRKEISSRIGVSVRALRYMTEEEIPEMLLGKTRVAKQALEKRFQRVIIRKSRAVGYEVIADKRVDELWRDLTPKTGQEPFIKGVSAALGKIKGAVKVLLAPSDIAKVKQGDVLVASMTTPDYVSAMKKASAIITDEGGITCHAAIVSRELGIPCIIGTGVATRVLKDNDIVEVDADKGLVKIIKK